MKFSDTVRFITGLLVMYIAWQLHNAGVFVRLGSFFDFSGSHRGSFGGVSDIILGVVPVVVDAVMVVGTLSLAFFGFCWKAVKPLCVKLAILLDRKLEEYGVDLYELEARVAPKPAPKNLDVDKLEELLLDISDRITALEQEV
jgi:hypothetical protein